MRNLPTTPLLVLAVCCSVALAAYSTVSPYSRSPYFSRVQNAETGGTYPEAVAARFADMRWKYTQLRTFVPGSSFVLFLLGLLAMRHRLFDDPKGNRRVILTAMAFGFASWSIFWFVFPRLGIERNPGIVSDQWLALTYAGAVTLFLAYRPEWTKRLAMFGVTGRMALTNYVLQAAIVSWLASGYGMGLKIRPYLELPATMLVFLVMVVFSSLWLRQFRYGPLERVWRSATYLSWR